MTTGGQKRFWTSEHNATVNAKMDLPDRIGVYDTTLRDGEQTAGLVFTQSDKVEIACLLDRVGVDRIEVGMPAVSEEDRQAIRAIREEGLSAELWGFCRSREDDVDACLDLGITNLLVEYPISPIKHAAYGFDPETVTDVIGNSVRYAKKKGAYVAFMAVDGTRASEEQLLAAMSAAAEGGADELVLPDTVGGASPEAIAHLIGLMSENFDLPLGVHCHNEFGMATAGTMAGVVAGAEWVHTTVNGLGEKSGNSDMAEVVLAAAGLYGIDSSIDFAQLTSLAKEVERISRVPLSPMKAVVGDNVFRRESGGVIMQMVKSPESVETYDPAIVGQSREIILGKQSGKASIYAVLEDSLDGLKLTSDMVGELVAKVKDLSIERKGAVSRAELLDMAKVLSSGD